MTFKKTFKLIFVHSHYCKLILRNHLNFFMKTMVFCGLLLRSLEALTTAQIMKVHFCHIPPILHYGTLKYAKLTKFNCNKKEKTWQNEICQLFFKKMKISVKTLHIHELFKTFVENLLRVLKTETLKISILNSDLK